MNNKNKKSQREYSPDFFDSLYLNKKWTWDYFLNLLTKNFKKVSKNCA